MDKTELRSILFAVRSFSFSSLLNITEEQEEKKQAAVKKERRRRKNSWLIRRGGEQWANYETHSEKKILERDQLQGRWKVHDFEQGQEASDL